MLAIFGFLMAWNYNSPWYVWVIGAFCLYIDSDRTKGRDFNLLAMFGFFMAVAYDSPWYVWLIGLFCLCLSSEGKEEKDSAKDENVEQTQSSSVDK